MITPEELDNINWKPINKNSHIFSDINNEFEFNTKSQELWDINNELGGVDKVCKVTKINKLREICYLIKGYEF